MVSLLDSVVENRSLQDVARSWGVGAEQAARRLRKVPFVVLSHADSRGGGRGRPGRRLALDPNWQFWDRAGKRPLGKLLVGLRTLHELGEPFVLGVPFTSTFLRPFLHPEVRLLVPPETFSLWGRLFAGTSGKLSVVVDLLPKSAHPVEVEGLPVLNQPFATVDALLGFERMRNLNLLALADWLAHRYPGLDAAVPFAASRGVDNDVRYLEDHRRRRGVRVVQPEEVRQAHRLAYEMARVPTETKFQELLAREALARD